VIYVLTETQVGRRSKESEMQRKTGQLSSQGLGLRESLGILEGVYRALDAILGFWRSVRNVEVWRLCLGQELEPSCVKGLKVPTQGGSTRNACHCLDS
jgi:hypothetical protein